MSHKKWLIPCITLAALALLAVVTVWADPPAQEPDVVTEALSTAFTYQGQLNLDGQPVDNTCAFQFSLYDDEQGSTQIGATQIISHVQVTGGLFTVQLDFGADAFQGDARWLGIEVQCTSDTEYTDLGLQALTATPYALYALGAPWDGLTDVPAGFADGVDDVGSGDGDIAAVYAGDGLIGGGESGDVTITVAFSGTGATAYVARSDHDHAGVYSLVNHTHPGSDIIGPVAEAISATWAITATYAGTAGDADTLDGQHGTYYLDWINLANVPPGFADGIDDDTTYTAGVGLVMTGTELSVDFDAVAPLSHTHTFTCPDELKYFEEEWSISTSGASDWEFFSTDSDIYLVVANNRGDATSNIDSKIYRWNGTSFSLTQAISTNGAFDWEFFTIGDEAYLAVANNWNGSSFNTDSKIYRWNGTIFSETQAILTSGARDWEAFTIDGDTYLAVANYYDDSTHNIDSQIYHWNGTSFSETQSITTSGAYDWEFFTVSGDTYLAVANYRNNSSRNVDSKIYRWNGTSFVQFQSIPTNGAMDWEFFTIGDDAYLAVANYYNDATWNTNSRVYRWNGTSFDLFQSIPTNGAHDWEFFTIGDDAYLVVANYRNNADQNVDSKLYRWNGTEFVETQSIPTNGARDWEFLTLGRDIYLVVANNYDGSTYATDSRIYKAKLRNCCCGAVNPQPTLQTRGYNHLDTLTAAPPAADCDEDSERGRTKADVTNNRLYICTNSGWTWTALSP